MASYEKPTEDLPIFNPSVFVDENEALTIATGSRFFLRYPFAQGTENLQDTNVNGLLTANADIDITQNSEIKWDNILNNYLINQRLPKAITSGGRNISLGHSALHDIDTGNDCIGIGFNAGSKITSSVGNLCIGTRAGENLNSNNNILLGTNSGQNISTSYNNLGIGSETLVSLTSGGFANTAIGRFNLNSLSGASYDNCAIGGVDVMRNLPLGISNIGIGTATWRDRITNMTNNVSIGYQSNMTQLSGNNCTALGTQTNNGGFSDSTCIGYQAQNTANNQIRLGRATETVSCPNTLSFVMTSDNTAGTYFIPFSKVSAGTEGQLYIDDTTGPLSYDPSTSTLSCAYSNLSLGVVNPDATLRNYFYTNRTTRPIGTDTIAIGHNAGNALLTSQNGNIFIGSNAGQLINNSQNGVFIGTNCQSVATNGSGNVVVGASATASTFQRCTVLGVNAAATGDDQVVLGTNLSTVRALLRIRCPAYESTSSTTAMTLGATNTTANITLGEALTSGNILIGPQASGAPSSNVTIMPRGGWNGVFQVGGNSASANALLACPVEINYAIKTSTSTSPTDIRQLGYRTTKTTGWTATITSTQADLNSITIDNVAIAYGVYTITVYLNYSQSANGTVDISVSTVSATAQSPLTRRYSPASVSDGILFTRTISAYATTTFYVVGINSVGATATLDTAGTDQCFIELTRIA